MPLFGSLNAGVSLAGLHPAAPAAPVTLAAALGYAVLTWAGRRKAAGG